MKSFQRQDVQDFFLKIQHLHILSSYFNHNTQVLHSAIWYSCPHALGSWQTHQSPLSLLLHIWPLRTHSSEGSWLQLIETTATNNQTNCGHFSLSDLKKGGVTERILYNQCRRWETERDIESFKRTIEEHNNSREVGKLRWRLVFGSCQ